MTELSRYFKVASSNQWWTLLGTCVGGQIYANEMLKVCIPSALGRYRCSEEKTLADPERRAKSVQGEGLAKFPKLSRFLKTRRILFPYASAIAFKLILIKNAYFSQKRRKCFILPIFDFSCTTQRRIQNVSKNWFGGGGAVKNFKDLYRLFIASLRLSNCFKPNLS